MQIGRKVLTTYEPVITEENVISILQKVMPKHLENANRRKLGAIADIPVYSIPYPQIKKIAAIKNHIWGL